MDLELRGKVAVVTGGSSGIGLAAARELAREGASVVIVARTASTLEVAMGAVEGGVAVVADVSDLTSVATMVDEVIRRLGGIDILVNCASPQVRQMGTLPLADTSYDRLRFDLETKVLGALHCAQAVAPHMIAQGWGRIVNVSGGAARNAAGTIPSVRNVSLVALTKNLADELGPHGINVTVIHPGLVKTERRLAEFAAQATSQGISVEELERRSTGNVAVRRWMTPEEIAHVIAFLASPRSVAISGDVLAVGGGAGRAIYY